MPIPLLDRALARLGYEHASARDARSIADLPAADRDVVERVAPYTLTPPERRASLVAAIDHLVRRRVPGDIVECGVWRGGSAMAAALALMQRGDTARTLWLYDTFEGMPSPDGRDRNLRGESAAGELARTQKGTGVWCEASLEDVQANLASTGYPPERLRYVPGKVEDTLPGQAPQRIALLRLDTDWHASTLHELHHLYPRLEPGGVLIVDDYGHWQGAREAVDEYFAEHDPAVFLHRVDYSARLVVKR